MGFARNRRRRRYVRFFFPLRATRRRRSVSPVVGPLSVTVQTVKALGTCSEMTRTLKKLEMSFITSAER